MDDAAYDGENDEPGAQARRPGLPLEPRRVWGIVAPERRRLLRAFLWGSAIALVAFFFLPKSYESEAVLLYEGSPLPGEDEEQNPTPRAFVESATVPNRLAEIRERLDWDVSLEDLEGQLTAKQYGEESMRLTGRAGTAEEAHLLTKTFVDVFLTNQSKFNTKELQRLMAENQIARERAIERRDAAQAAYDAFRTESGRPDLLDEKAQLLARAAELRSRADEAEVEIAAQRARIEELESAQGELPRQIVASAKKGSAVEGPLAQARADLAEARASLSNAHPKVQALQQRVTRLQSQKGSSPVEIGEQTLAANPARTAVEKELAGARAALAGAQERLAALRVLLDSLQRETEALAPEEAEARKVIGELEASIARIRELTDTAAALRDAALGPLEGFRVVSAPVAPEQAERSSAAVAAVAALPFLVVLVFAIVLVVRALRTLRVEAPREVAWWGNGPVLGTTVWPRDATALDAFVDELEDLGAYGAGRTLVVPASETERDVACSFAMRLAAAPWLAAAILDVDDRASEYISRMPLVTSPPTPPPRRLSSQGTSSVPHGRAIPHKRTVQGFVPPGAKGGVPPVVTPAPEPASDHPPSSRPPRKKTVIGLPAVTLSESDPPATSASSSTPPASASTGGVGPASRPASGPQPFRRKRDVRATVRMMMSVRPDAASGEAAPANDAGIDEQAFLLRRPMPTAPQGAASKAGRAVHVATETAQGQASNAVMRAAIRLLGDDDDDVTQLRRSEPPTSTARQDDVSGVALAWNGPLSGPVLRRAARLAHRVIVVVSSGSSVVDLARVKTRLGRTSGVGFVLVNVQDAYVDVEDRVGPVVEFWQGEHRATPTEPGGR